MLAWLKLALGRRPSIPAVGVSTALRPAALPGVGASGATTTVAPSVGQRRPLVGRTGAVAGFELRLPASIDQRLAERADDNARAAHFSLLMTAAQGLRDAGRQVLVQIPGSVLVRPGVADRAPSGALLLPYGPTAPNALREASWQALRRRGVALGTPDGPPQAAPQTADFVLLQPLGGGIDTLLLAAQRWHEARPHLPQVALGLEHIDDIERALASGVTLAGGQMGAGNARAGGKRLHAAAHRICGLLNDLALDRDTGQVAEAVRGDVALSYRLLRYANSPAIGLARGVDGVEEAMQVLGRVELGRWLGVMLLAAAAGRQASAALQEDALARARLLETLARRRSDPRLHAPESLFTLGLMSRLPLLLQMSQADALEPLRLSDNVRHALTQRGGPLACYLALADTLETDDQLRLEADAAAFGGSASVLDDAAQAWAWAQSVVSAGAAHAP
jgi:EAL and modified HD-GYP domain-containing signal transduction protein